MAPHTHPDGLPLSFDSGNLNSADAPAPLTLSCASRCWTTLEQKSLFVCILCLLTESCRVNAVRQGSCFFANLQGRDELHLTASAGSSGSLRSAVARKFESGARPSKPRSGARKAVPNPCHQKPRTGSGCDQRGMGEKWY